MWKNKRLRAWSVKKWEQEHLFLWEASELHKRGMSLDKIALVLEDFTDEQVDQVMAYYKKNKDVLLEDILEILDNPPTHLPN